MFESPIMKVFLAQCFFFSHKLTLRLHNYESVSVNKECAHCKSFSWNNFHCT